MSETILVVDDEKEIADLVELYLSNEGYRVEKFYEALPALDYTRREEPALAVLDVMLPDMDGFTLCQRIRENHLYPIIMLTARVEDMDKITGLTLGADDYVTKPFNPLELVARVKTQLRRYTRYNQGAPAQPEEYDIRGLQISKAAHRCTLFGEELSLTPLEFSILWYLCRRQGRQYGRIFSVFGEPGLLFCWPLAWGRRWREPCFPWEWPFRRRRLWQRFFRRCCSGG